MKKLLTLLLLLFVLTACSSPDSGTPPTEPQPDSTGNAETVETEPVTEPEPEPEPEPTTEPVTEPVTEPESSILENLPEYFWFCSGAGAWSTELYIAPDGTFTGLFHDSNMGETGDGYPGGTVYVCNFSGKFSQPTQVDAYTYSMRMESIETEETPGEESYEDEVRYVTSTPYGLEEADEVLLYLPGKSVSELPEAFLQWSHGSAYWWDEASETIPFYGLYNVSEELGFTGQMPQ